VVALCVRCGKLPRAAGETWLCDSCSADQAAYVEAIDARDHGTNVKERRRYAIAVHHWAGGWPAMREP
jgi:hypothetical protein